jgi:hypothetical protein
MGPDNVTSTTKYDGIVVQSSLLGISIPKGWGTNKVGCNLMDYLDFSAKQTSSGKGGANPQYTYKATLVLGIVQGPISGVRTIYKDQAYYTATASGSKEVNGTTITISSKSPEQAAGITEIFTGEIGQAPWTYLQTDAPTHAIGYSGICYAAAYHYPLDTSATSPNHNFEVQFNIRATVQGVVQDDANPADILNDLLPDVPRWPANAIGDLSTYSTYCLAQGLLLSPVANNGRQASDLVTEIMTATNSDCFWSDGQLKVAPYGDTAITNNGATYTPNLTPIYALGWDDIIPNSKGEDPIQWDLTRTLEAYNYVQVSFLDRTLQYATNTATAVDQANINAFGRRQQSPQEFDSVCLMSTASTIAQLMVQRSANVRRTAQFTVSELFGLLDPMDLITVPLRDGGNRLVRIVEANEQHDGSIQLQVEEMLVGAAHAAEYTRQDSLGIAANFNVDPGDTYAPAIINPPVSLTNGANEVWIAAAGGPDWGGCVVWSSFDGDTYQQVATISQPGRYGLTLNDFPAIGGAAPANAAIYQAESLVYGADGVIYGSPARTTVQTVDTTHTLDVSLAESGGTLTAATVADANGQATLCAVGTEIIAYSSALLTAANTYALGDYILRGLEGTTVADQPAGSLFMRLDNSLAVVPYNAGQVGLTLYIKLQSFNLYGGGYQDLDLCTAYEFIAEPNGAQVGDVAWTAISGIPALLTSYVESNGTAVNTANVGTATAETIEAIPAQVAAAVASIEANATDISTNATNIATAILQGAALQAYTNAVTSLNGQPIGVVLQTGQASQATNNASYESNFTLLGAKNAAGTAWVFDGSTTYVDGTTTLADHLNYVESVLGDGSVSIASINEETSNLGAQLTASVAANNSSFAAITEQVTDLSGKITLSVNANNQISGVELGVSGTSSYFTILSSKFQLVDVSSGQTLIPLSYTDGAWTFNSNVTINGALIVNGSVGTGAIDPGSITNTTYTESTASISLGAVGSAAVAIGSLTLTLSGAPVTVDVFCQINNTDTTHDASTINITLERDGVQISDPFYCFVRQNSSTISGGQPASQFAPFFDTGATAGSHTYTVYAQWTTGGGSSGSVSSKLCRIIVQDLKTEA